MRRSLDVAALARVLPTMCTAALVVVTAMVCGRVLPIASAMGQNPCPQPEALAEWVDEWPAAHALFVEDDLVVLFTYPHPVRLWAETASIYHLPSASCIHLSWDGEVSARHDVTDEGRVCLNRVFQDEALMERIRQLTPWASRAQ
jgi:hypothetical protein